MTKKKQNYQAGDVFIVPSTVEGSYIGQVVADTQDEIGGPLCVFYSREASSKSAHTCVDLAQLQIISESFVTPELITRGIWKICANKPVPVDSAHRKLETARNKGYVGTVLVGGGLVAEYLDTYYGLISESQWP